MGQEENLEKELWETRDLLSRSMFPHFFLGTNGRSKGKAWEEVIVALSPSSTFPLSLRRLLINYLVSLPAELVEVERWKGEVGKPVEGRAVVLVVIDVLLFLTDDSVDQGWSGKGRRSCGCE